MTEQSPSEEPRSEDRQSQDRQSAQESTERRSGADDDLGGPGAALGSGVEDALTGDQPRAGDEGKASGSPEPEG